MPLFDFRCNACKYVWRDYFLHRWIAKREWPKCQLCGSDMEKLIAAPSFVLKGAGFFSVDYPKKEK